MQMLTREVFPIPGYGRKQTESQTIVPRLILLQVSAQPASLQFFSPVPFLRVPGAVILERYSKSQKKSILSCSL